MSRHLLFIFVASFSLSAVVLADSIRMNREPAPLLQDGHSKPWLSNMKKFVSGPQPSNQQGVNINHPILGTGETTVKPDVITSNNISSNVTENVISILSNETSHHDDSIYRSSIDKLKEHLNLDTGAVKRTFYVVAGLTGVVVLYFMVKGIRLRRKHRVTRYGLLAERELETVEDGDDEDEDMTLFDASRFKKKGRGP